MKRKIIKQGNNTLTITLPKDWTSNHKITAGDELNIELIGNKLILSTEKLISFGKKDKDISKLKDILPILILNLYRKGYDEVELTFDKAQINLVIQNIINSNTIGFHIIEDTKKSCLLKALEVNDNDFEQILRKLFILVKIKLEKLESYFNVNSHEELQYILASNMIPTKITNFCHRLLSKTSSEKSMYLFSILSNLENLDNQLNLIIENLFNNKLNSSALIKTINDLKMIYVNFYDNFYSYNIDNLAPLVNKKHLLSQRMHSISPNILENDNSFFLSINNALLYLNNMIDTALLMTI